MYDSTLRAHLDELHPAYRAVHTIADPTLRTEAAKIIDFALTQHLPVPAIDQASEANGCWRAAIQTAHPDRKCVSYILTNFSAWWKRIEPPARPAFLEGFPHLAPAVHDLSNAGMGHVIQAVNRDPRLLPVIYSYAMTTGEAIRAVARLATSCDVAQLQKLVDVFPAQRMEASKDAERFLPALGAVPDALPLALVLTEHNVSSAYAVCRALKNLDRPPTYVDDFRLLVECIGISVSGVCLHELPRWHKQHGAEATHRFVQAAAECGRTYGVHAGQQFLERRTQAARQLLP